MLNGKITYYHWKIHSAARVCLQWAVLWYVLDPFVLQRYKHRRLGCVYPIGVRSWLIFRSFFWCRWGLTKSCGGDRIFLVVPRHTSGCGGLILLTFPLSPSIGHICQSFIDKAVELNFIGGCLDRIRTPWILVTPLRTWSFGIVHDLPKLSI